MAHLPKALYRGTVSTAVTVSATVPNLKQWTVTNVVLSNAHATATSSVTVKLDGVVLVPAFSLSPGVLFTLDCAQVLAAGKLVEVTSSAASTIGVHVSGVESDA